MLRVCAPPYATLRPAYPGLSSPDWGLLPARGAPNIPAQTVFKKGLAHVPERWRQDSPADVPAVLAHWIGELGELLEARGTLRALLRQLGSRSGLAPDAPPPVRGGRACLGPYMLCWHLPLRVAFFGATCPPADELCQAASPVPGNLSALLSSCAKCHCAGMPQAPQEVVPLVAQLVEFERAALHSREVVAAAETVLATQPGAEWRLWHVV